MRGGAEFFLPTSTTAQKGHYVKVTGLADILAPMSVKTGGGGCWRSNDKLWQRKLPVRLAPSGSLFRQATN
jgi:hypothetical protein